MGGTSRSSITTQHLVYFRPTHIQLSHAPRTFSTNAYPGCWRPDDAEAFLRRHRSHFEVAVGPNLGWRCPIQLAMSIFGFGTE